MKTRLYHVQAWDADVFQDEMEKGVDGCEKAGGTVTGVAHSVAAHHGDDLYSAVITCTYPDDTEAEDAE
jgi:hypothetical protein